MVILQDTLKGKNSGISFLVMNLLAINLASIHSPICREFNWDLVLHVLFF